VRLQLCLDLYQCQWREARPYGQTSLATRPYHCGLGPCGTRDARAVPYFSPSHTSPGILPGPFTRSPAREGAQYVSKAFVVLVHVPQDRGSPARESFVVAYRTRVEAEAKIRNLYSSDLNVTFCTRAIRYGNGNSQPDPR
jgi:hypothetical protein